MLIDSNIIMEIPRRQKFAAECKLFLEAVQSGQFSEKIFITRFALSSIEAMLNKVDKNFLKKILLSITNGNINLFDTTIDDELLILASQESLGLDFDDAVQFVAANRLHTYIVTFDKDFKKTEIQLKTPAQVVKETFK